MAPKKRVLTDDEMLHLVAGVAVCFGKAILESEVPLLALGTLGAGAARREGLKLAASVANNFAGLIQTAETNGTLPKLRTATDKVKKAVKKKILDSE